jgi:hypothetical protein
VKLPADHVAVIDRVLARLVARYGKPLGYSRRGKVFIDTIDSESMESEIQRYRTWRWCPAPEVGGLRTHCAASVTLALDVISGEGAVLYSTPVLWSSRLRARTMASRATRCIARCTRATSHRACRKVRL